MNIKEYQTAKPLMEELQKLRRKVETAKRRARIAGQGNDEPGKAARWIMQALEA